METSQATAPLVSVIIPAFNAEALLARTLESVLRQTYQNLEVLVVDDGSCDRTPEIVQQFAQQDRRLRLLRQANAGVAAARNLGIQHTNGEFVALIDADDIWYPENIEKQVNYALEGSTLVGVVYSWSVYIDETDAPLGGFRAFAIAGDVFLTLLCHNFLGNASASLIRRSCLEKVGLYDTELRAQNAQGCEDWDLYLRIAEQYQFRVVPEFLIGYRKLLNSMSRDYTTMANSYCLVLQSVQQRHPEIPESLFRLSVGNFFMYLAFECDRVGDFKNTLLWIRRALQSDPITPLLRPSLYRLVLRSCWQSRTRRSHASTLTQPALALQKHHPPTHTPSGIRQQISIQLMVLIGNLFHRLVPLLAGLPKHCQVAQHSGYKL